MKNYLLLIFVLTGSLLLGGCKDREEPMPDSVYMFGNSGEAPKTAGKISVTVYATRSWTASADSWITVEPDSGEQGIHAVHLSFGENTGEEPRTGEVAFKAGAYTETYTLTQKK